MKPFVAFVSVLLLTGVIAACGTREYGTAAAPTAPTARPLLASSGAVSSMSGFVLDTLFMPVWVPEWRLVAGPP